MRMRNRIELYVATLGTINSGISKRTRIVSSANVTWNLFKVMSKFLEEKGYIIVTIEKGKPRYFITDTGKQIVIDFMSVEKRLEGIYDEKWYVK